MNRSALRLDQMRWRRSWRLSLRSVSGSGVSCAWPLKLTSSSPCSQFCGQRCASAWVRPPVWRLLAFPFSRVAIWSITQRLALDHHRSLLWLATQLGYWAFICLSRHHHYGCSFPLLTLLVLLLMKIKTGTLELLIFRAFDIGYFK